jgi:cyclohexadieny/prephenate dehydrogenase
MAVIYDRVALIGLGLIAGSMAHAMRRGGLAGEIVGTARSAETREIARKIGLCDRIVDTSAEAVEGADLVVLCVPVGAMGSVAREIAPHLAPGATVSDVGSVKRDVIAEVGRTCPKACISCRVTRLPGRSIRARPRASRNSSTIATRS